jgi:hypothetical protein
VSKPSNNEYREFDRLMADLSNIVRDELEEQMKQNDIKGINSINGLYVKIGLRFDFPLEGNDNSESENVISCESIYPFVDPIGNNEQN